MKKFYNIFLTIAALAAVASCSQEEIAYEPGEPDVEGCYGVFFPTQEAIGDLTLDPTKPTETDITVARTYTKGAITVPVEITDPKGVYQLDAITFEDGQSETTLHIAFPTAEMGVKYPLTVKIADPKYASKYKEGATQFDFSVFRVEYKYILNPKTNEPAKITFTQDWWGETHTGKVKYYEVDGVRYCQTETDPLDYEGELGYGFFGCDASAASATEWDFVWYPNEKDEDGHQFVNIPVQFTGYISSSVGKVNVYDYFGYWTVLNPQAALAGLSFVDFCKKYGDSYPYSYYDGNGGFYFYTYVYCNEAGSGWKEDAYDIIGIADGFTRTDYTIEVEADYCSDAAVPVEFKLGADVAKVDYTIAAGELTKGQAEKVVASLTDGTATDVCTVSADDFEFDEEDGFNYYDFKVTPEGETGDYTVVAITYDENDEFKESAYASFFFVAAGDDDYDVNLNVLVDAVPARFESQGYLPTNSFQTTIWGSGLTDVKFAVYADANVQKFGYDAIVEDLCFEDEEKSFSISEASLSLVNTTYGNDFITGKLAANTKYWAFVWGTNGSQSKVIALPYTTAGLPNEEVGTGVFTYNSTEDEPEELSLEFNPNSESYLIPDWYFESGDFEFAVDEDANISCEEYYSLLDFGDGFYVLVMEGTDAVNPQYIEQLYGDEYSHYDEETSTYYFCTYWAVISGGKQVGEYYGVDTFELDAEAPAVSKSSFSFDKIQAVSGKAKTDLLKNVNFSHAENCEMLEFASDSVKTAKFQSRAIAHSEFQTSRPEASTIKKVEFCK